MASLCFERVNNTCELSLRISYKKIDSTNTQIPKYDNLLKDRINPIIQFVYDIAYASILRNVLDRNCSKQTIDVTMSLRRFDRTTL